MLRIREGRTSIVVAAACDVWPPDRRRAAANLRCRRAFAHRAILPGSTPMFMRVDRLQAELPSPKKADPNAAAALQELMGGKYGEMSTLNNYMFQSFNFRSKAKLRPFYNIVASITAEELGHVELVANGVAMLNNGPAGDETGDADISGAPFSDMADMRSAAAFLSAGGGAMPVDSNGLP